MRTKQQLVMDRPSALTDRPSALTARSIGSPNTTVKTILLHVQDDKALDMRLENALSIARACSAHVECLHVTPIEAYVAFDSFGGVFVMNDLMKALDEQETNLRLKIEAKLGKEDVSWNYVPITGNVASQLISHAALSDLVVTTREPHRRDFVGPTIGFLGDLLSRSRTPLLIPSDGGSPCDPTGGALIAWDGGYEAANAVRSSLGLIKLASSVHILQITGQEKQETFPSTRLLEYLSHHDIHAELSVIEAGVDAGDQEVISATIIARAQALHAAYLVMGGYNHSRIGEYIFGGVTRTMLAGSALPIVIAR